MTVSTNRSVMEVHDEDRYNERNDGHGEEEQPQLMVL